MNKVIWVIDDDTSIRWVLEKALQQDKQSVVCFTSADLAIKELSKGSEPAVIISDVRMPGTGGMEFLSLLQEKYAHIPTIIMTANTDLDSALSAYAEGAFEYLPKPFDIDEVIEVVHRALEQHTKNPINTRINTKSGTIIGSAPAMQELFRLLGRLSKSTLSVLINGETGTGKELVAKALHDSSIRKNGPFVAINTAAIPDELLESELFGHEKGSFTGANNARSGRFEQANGGTLFLDEIGDMPAEMQTRLLRVLAAGEFYRVGGHKLIKVDVRIIAASHQDLPTLVTTGHFREDLYHRLNVVGLNIPPLRDRREDIPELIQHFLQLAAQETQLETKEVSPEVLSIMQQYSWPGNVRELENICRRLTVMAPGRLIHLNDLPDSLETSENNSPADWQGQLTHWIRTELEKSPDNLGHVLIEKIERVLLEQALYITSGHKQKAALLLGWGRNTLTRKLKLLSTNSENESQT